MKVLNEDKALVLFSGGQDSTTCLYWALQQFKEVQALSIDYGQKHKIELEAASTICKQAGVSLVIIPCSSLKQLGSSSLLEEDGVVDNEMSEDDNLPTTFVPGRNLLFLTIAAAFAYQRQIKNIVTGVCQTDYSGYPDCRSNTISALQNALKLGMEADFSLYTPLMDLTKCESIYLAEEVGAIDALAFTHTCYNGVFPPCGNCQACLLRAKGFLEAEKEDPLLQRAKQP